MKHTHPTQRTILSALLSNEKAVRHARLIPAGVENDSFNYHLRQLLARGLVSKGANGYSLTWNGIRFIEEIDPNDPLGGTGDLFRLNVLMIVVRRTEDGVLILNQRRTRHPFYGDVGILGGSVRRGEAATAAASRKLREETGLDASFTCLGTVRKLRHAPDGQLLEDIVFQVCYSENAQGDPVSRSAFGENFWVPADEAVANESASQQGSPAVANIVGQIRQGPSSFATVCAEETSILTRM